MSELILKTRAGGEFWTDSDDCTAEGNFNVFYFASHDDEQPQAVATDCDSWAAAADQLAGYVKPADWEDFKHEFLSDSTPIFDSVDVDWGSHDFFNLGMTTQYRRFTGFAYLHTDSYAPVREPLIFNLYVPLIGLPYIDWVSELPAGVCLGTERLEAAALACIGRAELEKRKREQSDRRVFDSLGDLCDQMIELSESARRLYAAARLSDRPSGDCAALMELADSVIQLRRAIEDQKDCWALRVGV